MPTRPEWRRTSPVVASVRMSTATLSLALALLAIAMVLGAVWWGARRSGRAAAVAGLVAAGAGLVVQLAAVRANGGDHFDAMSVVYVDLVVVLPVVAAALLVASVLPRRWGAPRLGPAGRAVAAVALLAAPLGFYTTHVEPYRVTLDRAEQPLPAERDGDDTVRVGVLTDLQTTEIGAYERRAVRLLAEAEPDLVLVGGDLFQGTPAQFSANRDALRDLFTSLDAPGGVYVVQGDTDDGPTLDALFAGTGVTYLWNEVVDTRVGDRRVRLAGLGLGRGVEGRAALAELAAAPEGTVRIALTHRPDWALEAAPGTVDLVVAGHTHGGQVQVPVIGPLMTLTDVPRDVAAGGLHELRDNPVYVSHGVGHEQQGAPQIRFLAPPDVGLVTLG